MKTKVLAAVALTALLGTSLYAFNGDMKGMKTGVCPTNKMYNPMMKKNKKAGSFGVLGLVRQLNLSSEQIKDIQKIRQDMMKNRVKPSVAFTENGFDKDKYMEIMKQKRDNMLKSKAEMVDKVYKILTPKQKEQLKVLIDLRENRMVSMMDKRMNFGKNCNGRR